MGSFVCITGATGGLGKAFAVECAARGWDLFITDISEDTLSNFASSLSNTYGVKVMYFASDFTDHNSRTHLFDFMRSSKISFWSLINVAGVDFEGVFFDRPREEILTILRINVEATLDVSHEVIKLRDKSKKFRLITVASLAAFYPIPIKATYAASKRFLLNFFMAVRAEMKERNCSVTILCPGGMPTNEQVIKCIHAQGFMGIVTTNNVGYVASNTINRALKGKAVYIPGRVNRILRRIGGSVPQKFIAWALAMRWNKAFKKSHATAITPADA